MNAQNSSSEETTLTIDDLVAASHVDTSQMDPIEDVDHTIVNQLIKAEAWQQLIHYCANLSEENRDWVEALLDNEKIAKRLKFKDSKLSEKIRADLQRWGYDDISLNQLDDTIEIGGQRLTDSHESYINMTARDCGYGGRVKPLIAIQDVIRVIASENAYHPIQDFLNSLVWDGVNYIGNLAQYVTDEHEQITYTNGAKCTVFGAFFGKWLIGSIGKIFSSGAVRVQNPMLVLTGGQGLGKSTFIEWLCPLPEFFISSAINPDSTEHQRFLATKWIWEACELGSTTRRADREALKAFLTQQELNFRIPYAKHPIRRAAVTSFIGTLNPEDGYLNDPTGNRRFTTVELAKIDFAYSQALDPNQLWAQAMHIYKEKPHAWHYTPEEQVARNAINADHKTDMPFESQLLDLYEFGPECTQKYSTAEIMDELYRKYNISTTLGNQRLISVTLKGLGCEQLRLMVDKRKVRGYTGLCKRL